MNIRLLICCPNIHCANLFSRPCSCVDESSLQALLSQKCAVPSHLENGRQYRWYRWYRTLTSLRPALPTTVSPHRKVFSYQSAAAALPLNTSNIDTLLANLQAPGLTILAKALVHFQRRGLHTNLAVICIARVQQHHALNTASSFSAYVYRSPGSSSPLAPVCGDSLSKVRLVFLL